LNHFAKSGFLFDESVFVEGLNQSTRILTYERRTPVSLFNTHLIPSILSDPAQNAMNRILFAFLCCIAFNKAKADDVITGKVIGVIDGNTIEVLSSDNETRKILLAGIDSPELSQEFGEKAKKYLEKIVYQKKVRITLQGKDRKGNYLAIVIVKGTIDPRVELLKEGLAWTSENDPLPELEAHRLTAAKKRKGLWKNANPIPPWTYRREQSMMQPKSS
jgi:micrococcal nuclease